MNKKTDLSAYKNTWYKPGSLIKRMGWYFCSHIFFKSYIFHIRFLKIFILRVFGASIGKHVIIKPGVNIKYPWLLKIDDYVWIGENVWIDNLAKVSIGAHCCISQGAFLLCGNHNYKSITFDLMVKEIVMEDGVWIGAKAIVCPGVTCKTHAVLSVGSVATKDLEPYGIYIGNPAVQVRERRIELTKQ